MRRCCVNRLIPGVLTALTLLALVACGGQTQASERLIKTADYSEEEDPIENLNKEVDQALATGEGSGGTGTTTTGGTGTGTTTTGGTGTGTTTQPSTPGSGPGQLIIKCKCLSEEVPCDVVVLKNEDLSKVHAGKDNTQYSFSLNAGVYRVELKFHKAVNDPKLTLQNIVVDPGGTVERVVNFPMAQVKFVPVSGSGKGKVGGWKLRIKLKGATDWANNNVKLNDYVFMSPGLYEGQLYKGSKKKERTIDISSIQINEGAKSQVPIYVTH
jgi:hypothetical protein